MRFTIFRVALYVLVLGSVGIIFLIYRFSWTTWPASFVENLFAEVLGLAATVLIVDALLEYDRKVRTRAVRFAAFRELVWIHNRFIVFWVEAASSACPKSVDSSAGPFGEPVLRAFNFAFDLQSMAPTTPPVLWGHDCNRAFRAFKKEIEEVQHKYASSLDPETHHLLHMLETSPVVKLAPFAVQPGRKHFNLSSVRAYREFFDDFERFRKRLKADSKEFGKLKGFISISHRDADGVMSAIKTHRLLGSSHVPSPDYQNPHSSWFN